MKKVKIAIIIILIIILLLAGGTLAYMYIATDIFKTDKQLFMEYISQNKEIFEIFEDEKLVAYNNKKQSTPYENSGKYYVNGLEDYIPEQAKDFNVTFNGQTDKANKYVNQQINLNYSEDTSITIDYVNKQDYYGIKIDEILKKYLTLENNNLKEFAQKLGTTDITNIPDKIDFDTIKSETKFTQEEIEEIKSLIKTTLSENLTDEMFTSSETIEYKTYQLNLTDKQATTITNQLMEKISNNDIIMNRMKEIYKTQNNASEEETNQAIEEWKEKLTDKIKEEDEDLEELNLSITVYVQDKKLIKTELAIYSTTDEDEKYNIILNKETDNIALEIQSYEDSEFITQATFTIEKTKEEDQVRYTLVGKIKDAGEIGLSLKWDGLQTLEQVNEQYILAIEIDSEEIQYVLTNQNTFKQSITEKVQDTELEIINNYDAEKLTNTMEKLATAIEQLNEQKMNALGLEGDENPILYYIPLSIAMLTGQNGILAQAENATANNQVEIAKQTVLIDYTNVSAAYYNEQQYLDEGEDITEQEYIINNWTVSSDPSLYMIENGIITLTVPDENGIYLSGHINEEGNIVWDNNNSSR